jgi:hypothetical protein
MSTEINKAFEQQFSDNFVHLASQKDSKFGSRVRSEQVNDAKSFHFDRMDTVNMVQAVSRHEDTPLTEVPFSRRRVTFNTYRAVDLIDSPDRVKMAKDPTSSCSITMLILKKSRCISLLALISWKHY